MNKEHYYGFSIIVRGSKTFLDFRKPNNNYFFFENSTVQRKWLMVFMSLVIDLIQQSPSRFCD